MTNVTKLYATILSITLAATMTACGGIDLKQGGKNESKGAKAQPTTSQGASGKGVRFALALPAKFEEDGKEGGKGEKVEDSDMVEEFKETLASERMVVTCDGEPMTSYDKIKGKALRGIFELTLIGKSAWGGKEPSEKEPYEKEPSKKESFELKKGAPKDQDLDEKDLGDQENKEPEAPEAPEAPKPDDFSDMIVEHLAVPFVCPANATVEIVDLAGGYDYVIEANLYSASGALKYSGITDLFQAGEAKAVDLVMSPVQSSGVSINVIFADKETKKPAKK